MQEATVPGGSLDELLRVEGEGVVDCPQAGLSLAVAWQRAAGGPGHQCRCEWPPLQVEEEPGRGHLQEEHKEDAGGAGGEAAPLRALGFARGKMGGGWLELFMTGRQLCVPLQPAAPGGAVLASPGGGDCSWGWHCAFQSSLLILQL